LVILKSVLVYSSVCKIGIFYQSSAGSADFSGKISIRHNPHFCRYLLAVTLQTTPQQAKMAEIAGCGVGRGPKGGSGGLERI